ncbi:MAG: acyl-CoA dehydrogenase family protein [Burkholderiaceae bacterium]
MNALSTAITFDDEQAMLLDTAASFCREKSPLAAVRALIDAENGFDAGVWREMIELGWPGVAVPERFGGVGLSLAEATTIAEPMGRHLMATPFASTQLFVQGVLAGASEAWQQRLLPAICAGEVGTVALSEDDGDWNLAAPDCTVTLGDTTATLSGAKTLVCDADVARHFLVSVLLDGSPALAVLDASALDASRRRREIVIDETRRCFRIELDGLELAPDALIRGDAALNALRAIRNAALLLFSAEAAGGIAGALDVIVDYLNLRTAFGRKIGSYQSLKHSCAEILIALERTRSHLYHAATLMAAGENAEIALRMAKAEAGDGLVNAGDRGVQFHGGFGFTYECDAQLYLRRGLWLQHLYGDAAHHRRRLAELLLDPQP